MPLKRKTTLLKNGKVVDVRGGRVFEADVLMRRGLIAEIGKGIEPPPGAQVLDISGRYVAPGFMDAHIHVESSKLNPVEFACRAVLCGTTGIFADPHELANVFGRKAVEMFIDVSKLLPLDMFIGVPSCVPATHLETSGAKITLEDAVALLKDERVYGLAEMMNFPGIIRGFAPDARKMVDAAAQAGKVADGHCPGLRGKDLETYVSNGQGGGAVRIGSDHEVLSTDEALEKIAAGMRVMLREGSATNNLEMILPGLLKQNADMNKVLLCSDDLSAGDLIGRGHVNYMIDKASRIYRETLNLNPEEAAARAIRHATLDTAEYFRRPELGEIAAGKRANAVVFSNPEAMKIEMVFTGGALVALNGKLKIRKPRYDFTPFTNAMNVGREIREEDFRVGAEGLSAKVRVIGIIKDSLATENLELEMPIKDGTISADAKRDLLKIAVIERHHATGNMAVGFVKGIGIRRGALASTVAHDSHNIIVVGASDAEMAQAARMLVDIGGGMAAIAGVKSASLKLGLGGLMSLEKAERTAKSYVKIQNFARAIGSPLPNAFMTLSFLTLPVIPALKITDRGLVDVGKFDFTGLVLKGPEITP
jgi:adenine deaminase